MSFRIALVSGTQDKLNKYADQLNRMEIEAKGFAADITNKLQLAAAFQQIRNTTNSRFICWASIHQGIKQLLN